MSFPYQSQYMDYSNPATPITYPWDVDELATHASASISPEALHQPTQILPQAPQVQPQQMSEPPKPTRQQHASPSPSTYQAPATIHIQERVPPSQFRFDNIDESHFQQIQETPQRSATRSSSRKPTSLRVAVDQPRPSTASSSLGPSRVSHGSRQHAQAGHPYRRASDGAAPSAGGVRIQTGSRHARKSEDGSEPGLEVYEHRSRLGVGSDNALVGLLMPTVGGASTVSCPAVHSWRVNQSVPSQQQRSVNGGNAALDTAISSEATSPEAMPTSGSAHTPVAHDSTPSMPAPDEFPPSVPQVSRASSIQPPLQQPSAELLKRYNIRTDVHYNPATNLMTVMFELPGLKKSDLKIVMSVCPYSRVRQVTISGRSYSWLPEQGYTVKERKFGAFTRTVVVPPDTKLEDIEAVMEDGILILRVPGGTPGPPESLQEIPIL